MEYFIHFILYLKFFKRIFQNVKPFLHSTRYLLYSSASILRVTSSSTFGFSSSQLISPSSTSCLISPVHHSSYHTPSSSTHKIIFRNSLCYPLLLQKPPHSRGGFSFSICLGWRDPPRFFTTTIQFPLISSDMVVATLPEFDELQ